MHRFFSNLRFRRDHRWAPPRMSEYLDGELAARPRARMERHVAACSQCRQLIHGLRQVTDALGRLAPQEASRAAQLAAEVRPRLDGPPGA
jgi:anti-sigma factor RsiW